MKLSFLTAAAALALASSMGTAQAQTHGTVVIQSGGPSYQVIPAPPPPRAYAHPRARRGQVWVDGHWEWRGNRHRWVEGYWVKARPGYAYRQPQWVERNGRWHFEDGRWYTARGKGMRDRDRDGVPNRYDDRPNNPYRH